MFLVLPGIEQGPESVMLCCLLWISKGLSSKCAKMYERPCKNCKLSYTDQTNRKIGVKREEHKRVKHTISVLAQKVLMTGHKINSENKKDNKHERTSTNKDYTINQ
ncbi:hypothetical protein Trydic_g20781 [Trypoxylus dichotomus]